MVKRRARTLALATLAGFALAACNLALGLGGYEFSSGGTGGTSNHSSASSSMGGMGGSASSTGTAGMTSSTGSGHKDAGKDAGDVPTAEWIAGFDAGVGATVRAIAPGPNGTVYVTGTSPNVGGFGCPKNAGDAGDEGTGYLVEVNPQGGCEWGFFFGASAEGTGVAVDTSGKIALTGTFQGMLALGPAGTPTMKSQTMGMPATLLTDSFVAAFGSGASHPIDWVAHIMTDIPAMPPNPPPGDRKALGIAFAGGKVAVSGSYTGSLGVDAPPEMAPMPTRIAPSADAKDGFVLWFDATGGTFTNALTVTSPSGASVDQSVNRAALDGNGSVAFAGTAAGDTVFPGGGSQMANGGGDIFLGSYKFVPAGPVFNTLLSGILAQVGTSVAFDAQGDVLVGGQFGGTVGMISTADAGTSYTAATNNMDVLVARFAPNAPNGTPAASLHFGSSTPATTATLAGAVPSTLSGDTSVFLAGSYTGDASFLSIPSSPTITANGTTSSSIYVARVDETLGNVIWLKGYGNSSVATNNDGADAIAVDSSSGDVLIAGHYSGTFKFGSTSLPDASTNTWLFVGAIKP